MQLSDNVRDLIRQYSKDDDAYNKLLALFDEQLAEKTSDYRQRFENHDAVKLLIEQGTGRIVDANRAAARFYGYSLEQLCSMTIRDLNVLSLEAIHKEIDNARSENRPFYEFRHQLASGEIRDIHSFSSPVITSEGFYHHSIIVDVTGQHEVELRYRALFEQSNDAIFIMALDGQYLQVNHRAAEMLGYTYDEMQLLTPQQAIVQNEHPQINDVLHRLLSREQLAPYERTYRRKDGSTFLGEINAQLICDVDDTPLYIQAIVRDITRRKQMEQTTQAFLDDMKALQEIYLELGSIRQLDELYRNMILLSRERLGIERIGLFRLEESGDYLIGTFGTDADGTIRDERDFRDRITEQHWTLAVKDSPNHIKTWDDDDLYDNLAISGRGWKIASSLWSDNRSIGYLICDNLISKRSQRPYEVELVSLLATTFGHLIERLEAEAALFDMSISLQETVNASNIGLWSWDLVNDIGKYSALWKSQIGYAEDEFEDTHENFLSHVHPDDIEQVQMLIDKMIAENRKNQSIEFRLRHKDGSYRWILSQGSVYTDAQGVPIRMLGTHIDITERKQIQNREFEYALEKERLRLLTDFIQDAAHEFRTPLSTINSSVYLLKASDDKEYRLRKTVQIDLQVVRIQRLVDMLLMMVRLDSGQALRFSTIDIQAIITALSNNMRVKYGETPSLTVNMEDNLPTVLGDVTYLTEAFKQILSNAYQFTSDAGEISISVYVNNHEIWIEFQDTGTGISDDALPHIFDTFWRQDVAHSTPGFGLGLPIAKKIVEYHRGTIQVESTVGEGTCFTVKLPFI